MKHNWPSIDHSLLSPSGHMSKSARKAAMKREHDRLFPPGYWDQPTKTEAEKNQDKAGALRRTAATLRDLAERGVKPRAYARKAAGEFARARGWRCYELGGELIRLRNLYHNLTGSYLPAPRHTGRRQTSGRAKEIT